MTCDNVPWPITRHQAEGATSDIRDISDTSDTSDIRQWRLDNTSPGICLTYADKWILSEENEGGDSPLTFLWQISTKVMSQEGFHVAVCFIEAINVCFVMMRNAPE